MLELERVGSNHFDFEDGCSGIVSGSGSGVREAAADIHNEIIVFIPTQ